MSHTTGEDLTGSVTMSLIRYHELMNKAQQAELLGVVREDRDRHQRIALKLEEGLKVAVEYVDNRLPSIMIEQTGELRDRLKYIGVKAEWVPSVRKDGHGVKNEVKISLI